MSRPAQEFKSLLPVKEKRPKSATASMGVSSVLRNQFTITTWLCMGAATQGALLLLAGRYAWLPALSILLYRAFETIAITTGLKHNTYMDDIIPKKFAAQLPDELGHYGTKPADSEVVVFLVGTRTNHPLGLLAPGASTMGNYFQQMVENLEAHADEFGFLGMTSYINGSDRSSNSELMNVGYFRTTAGLQAFAHSSYHREAWNWWNRHTKQYPHLSIFHETYQVPKGHWESIYVNSHAGGITSTTFKITDEMSGEDRWASPVVDASKGLMKTAAGRMNKGKGNEHDVYGDDPY